MPEAFTFFLLFFRIVKQKMKNRKKIRTRKYVVLHDGCENLEECRRNRKDETIRQRLNKPDVLNDITNTNYSFIVDSYIGMVNDKQKSILYRVIFLRLTKLIAGLSNRSAVRTCALKISLYHKT